MTEEQLQRLDAAVLAALEDLGKTVRYGGWIPEWRFYKALARYSHKEIDAAVTRLADEIEISYMMHDKLEVYYRLAPAGGEKE